MNSVLNENSNENKDSDSKEISCECKNSSPKQLLLAKMEKTAYCKLNASKRNRSYANYFRFLSFFYNIGIIILSIVLFFVKSDILNIILLLVSVAVFSISLFVASFGFGEKERDLLMSYNEITALINRLKKSTDEEYSGIEELYTEVAHFSAIHYDADMIKLRYEYRSMFDYLKSDDEYLEVKSEHHWIRSRDFVIKTLTSLGTYALFCLLCLIAKRFVDFSAFFVNKKKERLKEFGEVRKELSSYVKELSLAACEREKAMLLIDEALHKYKKTNNKKKKFNIISQVKGNIAALASSKESK